MFLSDVYVWLFLPSPSDFSHHLRQKSLGRDKIMAQSRPSSKSIGAASSRSTIVEQDLEANSGAQDEKKKVSPRLREGEGESALPEDKRLEALERLDHDWQHDPDNPRNWAFWKKWRMAGIVSFYTFISPVSSSMMAPALPDVSIFASSIGNFQSAHRNYQIKAHYNLTSTMEFMSLSIFLLAYAMGPLFLSPLSELTGRKWVRDRQ